MNTQPKNQYTEFFSDPDSIIKHYGKDHNTYKQDVLKIVTTYLELTYQSPDEFLEDFYEHNYVDENTFYTSAENKIIRLFYTNES